MVSVETKMKCLDRFGMSKHFPAKQSVLVEIGKFLDELCQNDQEVERLTDAVTSRYSEWPGIAELRKIYQNEIATFRRQDERPDGCALCDGGVRRFFKIFEELSDGRQREQRIYADSNPSVAMRQSQLLFGKYRDSRTHRVYDAAIVYCSCALGQWRKEQQVKATENMRRYVPSGLNPEVVWVSFEEALR